MSETADPVVVEVTGGEVLEKVFKFVHTAHGEGGLASAFEGRYYATFDAAGEIGAVIALKKRGWFMTELRHLLVRPEFRGRGIGRAMVKAALDRVSTPLACATVRATNEAMLHINRSLGFKEVGRFENQGRVIVLFLFNRHPAQVES